jgi:hypothetical protein
MKQLDEENERRQASSRLFEVEIGQKETELENAVSIRN